MSLQLYTSNRLDALAQQLAAATASPLHSPLTPEIVIVHSGGMARWLSLQIAQLSGICMNCKFPFPKLFVERTLRQFFPKMAPESDFSVHVMAWKIFRLLPSLSEKPEFRQVTGYLAKDDGLKAFQLAEKLAHLFDQYLVYRPDMMMRWQRDRTEKDWQAILWRALVAESEPLHLAAIAEALEQRMAAPPERGDLPERISIFGLSSIPPFYLRVFFQLSRHCEVHLYSLEPSQEYFSHDLSGKKRAMLETGASDEAGNPLLASLGKLNRDFTDLRIALDEEAGFLTRDQPPVFIDPASSSMLELIQHDLLHAANRNDGDLPKVAISADDDSVQIHSCHSPMREVEVLYDHLLAMLDADPELQPRDILVMTPDIEKYAPLIHAVFGCPEDSQRHIPYSVADRRAGTDNAAVETLTALFGLAGSRVTASEIYSLLERVPIRQRFEFSDEELATIRAWIAETGIRWGIDGKHRAGFDLPDLEGHTWRAGLRRLLLGYAMRGGNRITFDGIMPHDEVEGTSAEVLGRFLSASDAMFDLATTLPRARPLRQWPDALAKIVRRFFPTETPEDLAELETIWATIDQLRRDSAALDYEEPVEFRVIQHHLRQLLDEGESRGGFLAGGVTFCALQPMRSIPAKVVALLGMSDQAFPRQSSAMAFDWMTKERRLGDRSSRDDDRYIFLETLISAHERLYISYLGRSVIDNALLPPSVLVSELLDCLDQSCTFPDEVKARDHLTREHRLHAFSDRYFTGDHSKLFTYSRANLAAAQRIRGGETLAAPAFLTGAVPEPGDEFRTIDLHKLVQFFASPAAYFLRERAGIRLEERDDSLGDSEPFSLDSLQSYHFREELLSRAVDSAPLEPSGHAALPLGEIGVSHFHEMKKDTETFWAKLQPELAGHTQAEPLLISLPLGQFVVTGKIESIYGRKLVHFRSSSIKPKDMLRAWVFHLAKCAVHPESATETVLLGTDTIVRLAPPADSASILADLLDTYWLGLTRPLPFFPASAMAFAAATLTPPPRSTAMRKAEAEWHGSTWTGGGEKNDRHNDYLFGDGNPLGEEFTKLALAVFIPMLQHVSKPA